MTDEHHTTIILKKFPASRGWDAYVKYGEKEYDSFGYDTRWGAKLSAKRLIRKLKRNEKKAEKLKNTPVKIKRYEV